MRAAIARAKEEHKAVRPQRQALRQHNTKINLYKKPDHEKPDRHWMLLKWKKKAAPEQREAYSSENAVRDLNSAAARRIKTTSRTYHLAGFGKSRNSLKTRCAALRLQLKISFPAEAQHAASRASAVK